ncbi:MAG: pilin [Candidatus Paceibacterota bacterium]
MKIFNGINFKTLLGISFIIIGFFSLFFISDTKVLAQTEDEIIIDTLGYSRLSLTEVIFNGAYYNNFNRLGFTTYFEYKEGNSDLNSGADKTIPIVRDSNVEEANDFYSSPSVTPFKIYHYRAVGCFEENPIKEEGCINDNSAKKFYGNVLSFNTGIFPSGAVIPYFVNYNNVFTNNPTCFNGATNYPACTDSIITKCKNGAVNYSMCTVDSARKCLNGRTNPTACTSICTNGAKNSPKCTTDADGNCLNKKGNPPECTTGSMVEDTGGGLVKCGTLFYEKGTKPINGVDVVGMVTKENQCGFNDVLILINDVIKFVLYKMVVPIAAIMFAYAGFELLTSGGETSKRQKAKKIFTDVAIGLIIAVAAFLIVKAILAIVGYSGQTFLE